jgi:hypothetical protein
MCKEELLDEIKVVGRVYSRYNLQNEEKSIIPALGRPCCVSVCNIPEDLVFSVT